MPETTDIEMFNPVLPADFTLNNQEIRMPIYINTEPTHPLCAARTLQDNDCTRTHKSGCTITIPQVDGFTYTAYFCGQHFGKLPMSYVSASDLPFNLNYLRLYNPKETIMPTTDDLNALTETLPFDLPADVTDMDDPCDCGCHCAAALPTVMWDPADGWSKCCDCNKMLEDTDDVETVTVRRYTERKDYNHFTCLPSTQVTMDLDEFFTTAMHTLTENSKLKGFVVRIKGDFFVIDRFQVTPINEIFCHTGSESNTTKENTTMSTPTTYKANRYPAKACSDCGNPVEAMKGIIVVTGPCVLQKGIVVFEDKDYAACVTWAKANSGLLKKATYSVKHRDCNTTVAATSSVPAATATKVASKGVKCGKCSTFEVPVYHTDVPAVKACYGV